MSSESIETAVQAAIDRVEDLGMSEIVASDWAAEVYDLQDEDDIILDRVRDELEEVA